MVYKVYLLIFTIIFVTELGAEEKEMKLTPYHDNIPLFILKGDTICEYDVFGFPASVTDRKKRSVSERHEIIEDYIFNLILQEEGNIPEVINSEEYKKNFSQLLSRNAVDNLKQLLIKEKFLTDKQISAFSKSNKSKYPDTKSEQGRNKIIAEIKKQKESEIKKYISDYLDQLKKENKVQYQEDLFKKVASIKAKDTDEFSESVKKIGLNSELIKYKDQTVDLRQLYNQIKQIKPYHLSKLSDIQILKTMAEGKILNSLLINKAEKKGLNKDKTVLELTKDQMKYFVAGKFRDIITSESKFIPTKDEMIDYYISHKDDEDLKSKRKMWVFEIFKFYDNNDEKDDNDKIKVALELESIRQKILNGEEFEKYAKFYPRPHSKDGELGFIFETDHALVGKTAAKMNEGDISELIFQEKAVSVIKVTKVQESMLYKFEYVEDIIKRILIEIKREQFLKNYKRELFEKYKVVLLADNNGENK